MPDRLHSTGREKERERERDRDREREREREKEMVKEKKGGEKVSEKKIGRMSEKNVLL